MKTPFLLAALLILPLAVGAEEATVSELSDCMLRNVPRPNSVRGARFSTRDRVGHDRDTLVKIFGKRGEDGRRKMLMEFLEPAEVKGGSLLILEREGANEMYFRADKDSKPRRIAGAGRALALFGSDFSYEDLEHALALPRPGETRLLGEDEYRGRPVHVVETRSADSSYERIITSVDKERCVAVKAEFYEKGRGLRKELTLNPSRTVKKDGIWIPQVALMTDLRDSTSTMLLVDSTEHGVDLADSMFAVQPNVASQP